MILVVGGAFQGKGRFAAELAETMKERHTECAVILNVHQMVREWLERGEKAEQEVIRDLTGKLAAENPQGIFTMDEVGCGVVPVSREERQYRDAVGWAGQQLAAQADMVYRVVAGIPVKIK